MSGFVFNLSNVVKAIGSQHTFSRTGEIVNILRFAHIRPCGSHRILQLSPSSSHVNNWVRLCHSKTLLHTHEEDCTSLLGRTLPTPRTKRSVGAKRLVFLPPRKLSELG